MAGVALLDHAAAREVSAEEVASLGEPDAHQPLLECDCVLLRWFEGGEALEFRVPRDGLLGVRRELLENGQHEVALVRSTGAPLVIERAPCPVARLMVLDYETLLRLPVTGTGVASACADVESRAAEYRTGRMVALGVPDFGPMAVVNATARRDAGSVVGDLDDARALLGRCLTLGGAVDPVAVSGRVARDGSLVRPRVTSVGGEPRAESCVVGNLTRATYGTVRGRVTVTVELAPPASP